MEQLSTEELESAATAAIAIFCARFPGLVDAGCEELAFKLGFADGAMFMVERMKELTK